MKFSILTLLAAIAYIALSLAALVDPLSAWRYGALIAWFAAVTYVLILATNSANRRQTVFGSVMLGGMVVYLLLTIVVRQVPHASQGDPTLPHEMVVSTFDPPGIPSPFQSRTVADSKRRALREYIAAANSALLFGLIGGTLASWRYRPIEKPPE